MDAKLEQMLIGELQPVVKFKRFEYTPMTDEDKEAMDGYIANPREYYRHMYPSSLLKPKGKRHD